MPHSIMEPLNGHSSSTGRNQVHKIRMHLAHCLCKLVDDMNQAPCEMLTFQHLVMLGRSLSIPDVLDLVGDIMKFSHAVDSDPSSEHANQFWTLFALVSHF